MLIFILSLWVQPYFKEHFLAQPWGFALPILAIMTLVGLIIFIRKKSFSRTFVASSLFIFLMISTIMYATYPNLLLAFPLQKYSLTIYNAGSNLYGLRVGLIWFSFGFILMLAYVSFMYRSFWGKVSENQQIYDH